jgi:sulfur carrier protein
MVTVNGTERNLAGVTLSDYLATTEYKPELIAVERNEEIVPKSRYAATILRDGDCIEIVSFVGGG